MNVHVVDLNGDAIPDLVLSDFASQVFVLIGEPDEDGFAQGVFADRVQINQSGVTARRMYTADPRDFNGDGVLDLLTSHARTGDPMTSDTMFLWIADGAGGYTPSATFPVFGYSPLVIDLNRDRIPDVVTGSERERRVLTGSGRVVGD